MVLASFRFKLSQIQAELGGAKNGKKKRIHRTGHLGNDGWEGISWDCSSGLLLAD